MAEWITHAQVRKRFQEHFCDSLYNHPELITPNTVVEWERMKDIMEEENGTALTLCNTTYRTNLHYAFLYRVNEKTYNNGKWHIAYITNDQRINVPFSASLIKEIYSCLEEKLKVQ